LLHPLGAFFGFTGPFVPVPDGDPLEVRPTTLPNRIPLAGIDCPE